MKCPLKFRLIDYGAEIERIYTGDCLKEECAWYDGKQCAILSVMEALRDIANSISNGVKK